MKSRPSSLAFDYVTGLLADFNLTFSHNEKNPTLNDWHSCGLEHISQCTSNNGLPLAADAALLAFKSLCETNIPIKSGSALLSERAQINEAKGTSPANTSGTARLLKCSNGHIILNLARDDDWDLLDALFETNVAPNWDTIECACVQKSAEELVNRGRLIGLAIAKADEIPMQSTWINKLNFGIQKLKQKPLRVIDFSALWAGPLCGHLLELAGCEVIKVESISRPDGARKGSDLFYDLLNQGKASLALDFSSKNDIAKLKTLIQRADIVIEASRPRALRQLGIVAEDLINQTPGLSWCSITAYGRDDPYANWIGYGDDVAVAAGLSARHFEQYGKWQILGDAIADPLTGLHAALACVASQLNGGGELLDVSMFGVTAYALNQLSDISYEQNIEQHITRAATIRAAALGADNLKFGFKAIQ